MNTNRRDMLKNFALGSAAALSAAAFAEPLLAQVKTEAKPEDLKLTALGRKYEPKPLPFDPAKLNGISEKLITSHHGNNYVAAVKGLSKCEELLASMAKDTPAFVVGGIKMHELMYSNSILMHEHYFGNLGGDGKLSGAISDVIAKSFGSLAAWEEQFKQAGMSLGGGSGWVVLAYNMHTGEVRNYWSNHHTLNLGFSQPLMVMDMYEHAYQMDYGAAHAKYIEAHFKNVNWEVVNERLEKAIKIAHVLKS